MLKQLLFLLLFPFITTAQDIPEKFVEIASKIQDFSINEEASHFFIKEVGEVRITNEEGNVLRFRYYEDKGNLAFHCGLYYSLNAFKDGWISSITTYGEDGCVKGDAEFDGQAIVQFEILNPERLEVQMDKLEDQDGNIEMSDAAEKIVLQSILNEQGELIREIYLDTDEYFMYQHLLYAP